MCFLIIKPCASRSIPSCPGTCCQRLQWHVARSCSSTANICPPSVIAVVPSSGTTSIGVPCSGIAGMPCSSTTAVTPTLVLPVCSTLAWLLRPTLALPACPALALPVCCDGTAESLSMNVKRNKALSYVIVFNAVTYKEGALCTDSACTRGCQ